MNQALREEEHLGHKVGRLWPRIGGDIGEHWGVPCWQHAVRQGALAGEPRHPAARSVRSMGWATRHEGAQGWTRRVGLQLHTIGNWAGAV